MNGSVDSEPAPINILKARPPIHSFSPSHGPVFRRASRGSSQRASAFAKPKVAVPVAHPIVLYQNQILDGRHRYEACKRARVTPRFERYTGNKPFEYCVSSNIKRRHLDAGQRAEIAAKFATLKHGGDRKTPNSGVGTSATYASQDQEPDPTLDPKSGEKKDAKVSKTTAQNGSAITQTEAAALMGVSITSVKLAAKIMAGAPDLMPQIKEGTLTLNAAEVILKKRHSDAKKAEKAAKAVLKADPEYKPPADPKSTQKEVLRDETGWPIPDELMPIWERRAEITDPMGMLKKLENLLKAKLAEIDPLYAPINVSATSMDLQRVHMGIRAGRLYAVCPICNGKLKEECNLCKSRGFINKTMWETGIPIEIKQVRQNIIDGKKVNASTT